MAKKERKYIKIRGASASVLTSREMSLLFLQGFQAPASHHWHLIPYMLRDSAGTWSHFHRMRVRF